MLLTAVFLFSIAYRSFCANPPLNWDRIRYVYAFGDSYSFVQGTRGFANFSFIGDATNFAFTPNQLLTNEIIPRNTSSEGSNWLEFLTGCFGGRPLACRKQLWDFAFAGADIDTALLPPHHDYTIPLINQVKQWLIYASNVIPHPLGQTLATWWIGINDTGDTVSNATITNFTAFWETEMDSYFNAVQTAHGHGLRAHLFINVPPGERAPASVGNPTKAALQKQHIDLYNAALSRYVARFAARNPDTTVVYFDAHSWFNSVLDNPALYGFKNVTGSCTCTDPGGYFWYNSGHPTEKVHRILAEAIEAQIRRP